MEITGSAGRCLTGEQGEKVKTASGALSATASACHGAHSYGDNRWALTFTLTASKNWTGATSNNSAVSSIFGKSNTVVPPSVKLRTKTKFK